MKNSMFVREFYATYVHSPQRWDISTTIIHPHNHLSFVLSIIQLGIRLGMEHNS